MECEFQIEVSDIDVIGNTPISFTLRITHSEHGAGNKVVQIPNNISDVITKTVIQNLALNFDLTREYLLFVCSASKNIQFALSIGRNSARFIS